MTAVKLINRVDVLQQLLAAVTVVPVGVKLSIPALRDALISQADVLAGLETLCLAGEIDRATLRPIALRITGATLASELEDYSKRHGLALSRVSKHLFGGGNALSRLRAKGAVRPRTIAKVRGFINAAPPPGLNARRSGGPRVAANGGFTGASLAAELDVMIQQHGLSKCRVGLHVYGNRHGVEVLRQSMPRMGTVEKVRALLANPPIEDLKPRDRWAARRAMRAAGPSPSQAQPGTAPEKVKLSFEEQLARVERGEVGIGPNLKFGRPDPTVTLGGVTGEINI